MRFTLPVLALASAALALPESAQTMAKLSNSAAFAKQAEGATCDVGSISCCNAATQTENGLLGGLLGGGLIRSLSGNDGSACAKASLIDELGLLGMFSLVLLTGWRGGYGWGRGEER
jgi:hypothetical protein